MVATIRRMWMRRRQVSVLLLDTGRMLRCSSGRWWCRSAVVLLLLHMGWWRMLLLLLVQMMIVHDCSWVRSWWSSRTRSWGRWCAVWMWGNILLLLLDAGIATVVAVVVGCGRARGWRCSGTRSRSSRWGRGSRGGSATLLLLLCLRRLYFLIHGCSSASGCAAPDLPDFPDRIFPDVWRLLMEHR